MQKYRVDEEKKLIEYFNEHWYQIGEEKYPSVTSILGVIAKGFGYDEWLKDVSKNAGKILEEAQLSGSKLHATFESFMLGNEVSAVGVEGEYTKKEWKKVNDWFNWYNEIEIEPLYIEEIVYSHEWKVAGTADLICRIGDDIVLIDWKTGNNIYETSEMQIAAYVHMFNSMSYDVKINKGYVVHVGATNKTFKDLNGPGIKSKEVNLERDIESFGDTLKVFNRMNPNIKAPDDEFKLSLKLEKNILKEK